MTRETVLTLAVLLAVFGSQAKSATVKYFTDPEAMVARYAVKATPAKNVEPTGRDWYWRYDVTGVSFGREGDEQCYDKLMGGVPCDQPSDDLFAPLAPYEPSLIASLAPAQQAAALTPAHYGPAFPPVWPCCGGGGGHGPGKPADPVEPPPVPLPPALALSFAALAALTLMRKK